MTCEASRQQTGGVISASAILHENSITGGSKRGEVFPLPFPDCRRRRAHASPVLTGDSEETYRIGESVAALFSLGGASARSTGRASFVFEGHRAVSGITPLRS